MCFHNRHFLPFNTVLSLNIYISKPYSCYLQIFLYSPRINESKSWKSRQLNLSEIQIEIQSKEEADKVLHTHDDQKVFITENNQVNNRTSMAFSQMSDMSKFTDAGPPNKTQGNNSLNMVNFLGISRTQFQWDV